MRSEYTQAETLTKLCCLGETEPESLSLFVLMETTGTLLLTLPGPASPLTRGGETRPSLGGDSGLSTETTGVTV